VRFGNRALRNNLGNSIVFPLVGAGRGSPAELLQFDLSQPTVSVIIACDQMALIEQIVQAGMNRTRIGESGKQRFQE